MEFDDRAREDLSDVLQFLVSHWEDSHDDSSALKAYRAARSLSERFLSPNEGETPIESSESLRERIRSLANAHDRMHRTGMFGVTFANPEDAARVRQILEEHAQRAKEKPDENPPYSEFMSTLDKKLGKVVYPRPGDGRTKIECLPTDTES